MKQKNNFMYISVVILLFCILGIGIIRTVNYKSPLVKNGYVSIPNSSIEDGVVKLDGSWRFHSNKLIVPEKMGASIGARNLEVPKVWINNPELHDAAEKGMYGTYELYIHVEDIDKIYSLSLFDIITAYRIYVDGELLGEVGRVGETKETHIPKYKTEIYSFKPTSNEIQVILQVSDFSQNEGGIWTSIYFGTQASILDHSKLLTITNTLFSTTLLVILLLLLFFAHYKDNRKLYISFAFFTLDFFIRTLISGNRLYTLLPFEFSFTFIYKLEYMTNYLMIPLFLLYNYFYLEDIVPGIIRKIAYGLLCISVGFTIFLPVGLLSYSGHLFQLFAVITLILMIYIYSLAVIKNKKYASQFIIVLLIAGVFMIGSFIFLNNLYLLQFGMFIMISGTFITVATIWLDSIKYRNIN